TPTSRNRCFGSRPTLFRKVSAMLVNSSHDDGGRFGVWLRVRILNSFVFNLSTTVLAIRVSLRDAAHTFSAKRRIIGSVSAIGTSSSNVSSAEMDLVGLSGTTSFS